jgi:hypothetical protein
VRRSGGMNHVRLSVNAEKVSQHEVGSLPHTHHTYMHRCLQLPGVVIQKFFSRRRAKEEGKKVYVETSIGNRNQLVRYV